MCSARSERCSPPFWHWLRATQPPRDVQFVAPYVACLDGIGASGDGAHTNDEDLEPGSIERATIRAALLIYRLTR
jgi:hypothetical protein